MTSTLYWNVRPAKDVTLPKTVDHWDGLRNRKHRVTRKRLLQAADDLEASAKLLTSKMWTTGTEVDCDGRMCAIGAIGAITCNDPNRPWSTLRGEIAVGIADRLIKAKDPQDPDCSIVDFNDQFSKYTDEQRKEGSSKVRKALRLAAKLARERAATLKR